MRNRHGIYALYRRGKLCYVGLARNLNSRLKQHLKDRHGESWDRFSVYLTIGDGHVKELESLLLQIVKPKGNKHGGGFAKSENLRRRLARDIRVQQKQELDSLVGRGVSDKRGKKTEAQPVRGGPVLSRYVTGPMKLRATLKGKKLRANVRRDGTIRFGGKIYDSPSRAAGVATGRAANGWSFWYSSEPPAIGSA